MTDIDRTHRIRTINELPGAKGDLAVGTEEGQFGRLAVGAEGYIPVSRAAEELGVKWEDPTPLIEAVATPLIETIVPLLVESIVPPLVESITFDPAKKYEFYEDFDAGQNLTGLIGRHGWGIGATSGTVFKGPAEAGVMGSYIVRTLATLNSARSMYNPMGTGTIDTDGIMLGTDPFDLKMRVKNTHAANANKLIRMGVINDYDSLSPVKGIFFTCGSGNWIAECNNGSAVQVDTLVAQTAAWETFRIKSTGVLVEFYIGGNLVASINTGITNAGMKFFFYVRNTATTIVEIAVDYFHMVAQITR